MFLRGRHSGVEEYTLKLLPRLVAFGKDISWVFFYNAFRRETLNFGWLKSGNASLREFSWPNQSLNLSSAVFHRPKLDRWLGGVDKFFSPHIIPAELSSGVKKIMTCHDLSFVHYPGFFSLQHNLWHWLSRPKRHAKRADRIIVDSDSTKDDLINYYNIGADKISVVPLGVDDQFRPIEKKDGRLDIVKAKYFLPDKFALYLGTLEPRKNIESIISAFAQFGLKHPDYSLVIAGSPGWKYRSIISAARSTGLAGKILFTGFIEDQDKSSVYNLAEFFLYPSFFEGFGLPVLEAMSCGVPTITSNRSSLPEVAGDAALMVDPYNVAELIWAMEELVGDKNLYGELKRRGLDKSKNFSWDKCAQATLDILRKA